MKNTVSLLFFGLSLVSNLGFTGEQPRTGEAIEVPIGQVFVPPHSYDELDTVQLVLDGALPNGCYSVANQDVRVDLFARRIDAHLFAFRRSDGPCAPGSKLPSELLPPVPYTLDVSLGRLPAGMWAVTYPRPRLGEGFRPFVVAKPDPNKLHFPSMSSVWIPDIVRADLPISADLVGSLTSTCGFLLPSASVELEDDVFVVSQGMGFKPNLLCAMIMIPFESTVQLGTVPPGRYMIHVKGMNGRSVNRVFSATDEWN